MRVLVTGHRGYVGSVVTCVLRHHRFDVVGLDCDLYQGCDFGRVDELVHAFEVDVCDIGFADLVSFDAVVHLAHCPVVGSMQAAGADPSVIVADQNLRDTMLLARLCKQADVPRFVFASCCGVYGDSHGHWCTEDSPPAPQNAEAISKLACEAELLRLKDDRFQPTILRLPDIFGVSPRLRLDNVVNDLVATAAASRIVQPTSPLTAYHPLVHLEDVARAIAAVLKADVSLVAGEVFNVVRSDQCHRLGDIVEEVAGTVPDCRRRAPIVAPGTFPNLRVRGAKLARVFPQLYLHWTLPRGVRQLFAAMSHAGMSPAEARSDRYRRNLRFSARSGRVAQRFLDAQPAR